MDVSQKALDVARENARAHAVDDRIEFIHSDWFENVPQDLRFDIITSNPPYIANPDLKNLPNEVKNHDPILALDGGAEGIAPYKIIFGQLTHRQAPCGRAFFEFGQGQCESLIRLVEDSHATLIHIHKDLAGIDRILEIDMGKR